MPTTLHEQLNDLAEEAGRSADPPSGRELWRRGRRYARVRRAGTVVITTATVIVLLVVGGVSWQRSARAAPVPANAPVGVPDRIYQPGKWLPGTDRHPPGQLIAVLPNVERGSWTGSTYDPLGISAVTGEYRFLDLPDAAYAGFGEDVLLSPDGRYVAYWVTGTPSGTPNTSDSGDPITGIALYDTVSGEVRRHEIETEHGLTEWGLSWIDDDSLLVEYGQRRSGGADDASSVRGPVLLWHTDESRPGPDDRSDQERRRYRTEARHGGVASPSGTRVAWPDPTRSPGRLWAQSLDPATAQPISAARRVPESGGSVDLFGWTDDDHVVVSHVGRNGDPAVMVTQDVRSGQATRLVDLGHSTWTGMQWASDLLDSPVVAAERPPDPMDPRKVLALSVGALLLGGLALLVWRRRVRP